MYKIKGVYLTGGKECYKIPTFCQCNIRKVTYKIKTQIVKFFPTYPMTPQYMGKDV